MDAEIQKLVGAGKLTKKQGDVLELLVPGSYCQHKSWGFGRVAELNLLLQQVLVDFDEKKGHEMRMDYAASSLQPIPASHILARVAEDAEAIRLMAKDDPLGLVRIVLESYDGKATQERFAASLVPKVFAEEAFRKWWATAKRLMKRDGHFNVPAKRNDPVSLREHAISRAEELIEQFEAAKQLKTKLAVLTEITKSLDAFDSPVEQLQPLVKRIEAEAATNQRLHPAATVEMILGRDEIVAGVEGLEAGRGALEIGAYLLQLGGRVGTVLEQLPAARQRGLIEGLRKAYGDKWTGMALDLMHTGSFRVVNECARVMGDAGCSGLVADALDRWIRERSITSEALLWLCKERKRHYKELVNPALLNAIISALERDQFNEKRTSRLQDLLLDDKELIGDMLAAADIEAAREAMRRLLLTPVFEELAKRSILARIIKLHPSLQSMLEGGEQDEREALIVSWKSLDARKKELEDLVNRQIPANSEEIRIAREYGDLRENFEFKAAKEMQAVLTRRRAELEHDLARARGTDFANPDTSQVSIGTTVDLRTSSGGQLSYSILGAWDSIPERGILSYKTALGQILMGRRVGDAVDLPADLGSEKAEIVSITPFAQASEFVV